MLAQNQITLKTVLERLENRPQGNSLTIFKETIMFLVISLNETYTKNN